MSWVRIWVHLIFSTKNRDPLLQKEIRQTIFQHIKENAEKKAIFLDSINGYTDHAHCLISLNKNQCISDTAQFIKGESSHWINKEKLTTTKFLWQDDYWAVGVSESQMQAVRKYIFNQENHHSKISFAEEVEELMQKYGWNHIIHKLDNSLQANGK